MGADARSARLKAACCKKYKRKAKACKRCPVMAPLSKKKRQRRLRKIRRKLAARP